MRSGYNCSLCEECNSLSPLHTNSLLEAVFFKLCEFVFISSVVATLHLIEIVICSEYSWKKLQLSDMKVKSQRIVHIMSLSLLIFTLPFITMLMTGAFFYKLFCFVAIKRKDRRFVKFLNSFDVFYCLEDKNTTDVQGIIQSNTIELAVDNIKEKLRKVFMNYSSDKIFYRRNEEYGFYYWRRYSYIDVAQYVQIEEVAGTNDNDTHETLIKLEKVNEIITNDEGLFKVVIAKNRGDNARDKHKITLKFHHSIKDAALTEFVARFVEKSDDFHVTLHSTSPLQDDGSADAIMGMITKLYDMLVRSLDVDHLNGHKHHGAISRLKSLEWSNSDENLLCAVKEACDYNLANIMGGTLSRILNKLER